MRFFTVQHTCDVIYKASPKQVMFIICKSAEDALKLVEGGVPVTETKYPQSTENSQPIHCTWGRRQMLT